MVIRNQWVEFCPRGYYIIDHFGQNFWCPTIDTVKNELLHRKSDFHPTVMTYDDRMARHQGRQPMCASAGVPVVVK